ncbi:dihydroneopterin aldolase [Hyphococcus luteus]|uniref:7,8-dihydroneopterin aldolase n=1 Tax=Hyphococcus luteus TaxID=2058213 RepID=A0A2S7K0W6_9PROT|nr:dihydroneopterin aldolase [Marinicaulis flavus]PQA86152.1 dihydroneopterin aldolase [Marinicaulis flavus]
MSKRQKTPMDITPLPRSETAPRRRVFVHDLVLDAYIGAYESEQGVTQPIKIDFEADVVEPANPVSDSLDDILCYDSMTQAIKAIIAEGHIKLVETLAERIADLILSEPMVISVMVRIVKPNAIPEAEAAGVEIIRTKR